MAKDEDKGKKTVVEGPSYSKTARDIMMKMNFDQSKGLGKNKQGITEPMQVLMRDKNVGLGYGESYLSLSKEKDQEEDFNKAYKEEDEEEQVLRYKEEVAAFEKTKREALLPTSQTTKVEQNQTIPKKPEPRYKIIIKQRKGKQDLKEQVNKDQKEQVIATEEKKEIPSSLVPYSDDESEDDGVQVEVVAPEKTKGEAPPSITSKTTKVVMAKEEEKKELHSPLVPYSDDESEDDDVQVEVAAFEKTKGEALPSTSQTNKVVIAAEEEKKEIPSALVPYSDDESEDDD